jgi:putative ABC transport system permease protein
METFIQDIHYGVRMLLKSPGFTAVAVLALALGIGANSAMFSVVNAVLLRPLPYPKAEQLFMVWKVVLSEGGFGTTPAEFLEWRQQNHVFKEMGAFFPQTFNLAGRGEPEQIEGLRATPGFFTTLGIKAIRGRTFLPEEERLGKTPAVLVSYRLWDQKFQADPNLIGSTLNLNDEPHVVVGIMPEGFEFSRYKADFWVPLTLAEPGAHAVRLRLTVIARLKPGVKPSQAQAEMSVIGARLRTKNGKDEGEEGPALVPLEREVVGNARETLLPMLGAVGLILLIGCATVANLLLARATMRHREMAVRAALGADRSRLIRQMLTESVLLATLGGMLGLVLANWGTSVLIAAAPENVPRLPEIEIDLRVLGFTLLISVLTGILFGLAPALRTSRIDLTESLKEGTKASGAGFGRHLLQNGLVVCEIALALVLLVGAGLLINSFAHLIRVDPGFRPENVLTMQISVPPYSYRGGRQISSFFRQVVERVRALPNVECAAVVPYLPLGRGVIHIAFTLKEGIARAWAEENKDWQVREFYPISPGYFQAMGTPLLSGRDFMDHDNIEGAPPVAIINESFSRKFFPEESPLGKRIRIMLGDTYIGCTIVGVAKDMKRAGLGDSQLWLSKGNMAAIYLPHSLLPEEDYHAPGDIGSIIHAARSPHEVQSSGHG